ncbi:MULTISPECIES: outer membrane protein [unclassified Bradyrhizobium]|uniref:outer membrane protein n=1 Tax=Bradyrhizobium TaxID=374 RepID=UPI0028ED645A|nr:MULTISPECIES: outer membrane beta-barrel protein [unclassified Bradyrhizobium]
MAWSRQQQTWSQVANAAAAPVQPVQQPVGNANNPPVVKPPVVANPAPNPPPPNNPGGNNGGWKPPHKPPQKPPICERGDKGWWQPGKPYGDKDHDWPKVGSKGGDNKSSWPSAPSKNKDNNYNDVKYGGGWFDKHHDDDHDKSSGWSQLHSNGYSDRSAWLHRDRQDDHDKPASGWGGKKDDGYDKPLGFGWSKQPLKSERDSYAWLKPDQRDDDKHGGYGWGGKPRDNDDGKGGYGDKQPDKDHWQQQGGNYHHGGWPYHPDKPWPPKNPPPNNGGGQPNPPPQGNNGNPPPQNQPPVAGGGNVAPLPVAAVQIPTAISSNGSDVIGGLQLGCDYQMDRFVVGIQAMADIGIINASSPLGPALTMNTRTSNLYTATVRAGYLVTPEILAYVRGGAAWTRTNVSVVNTATGQSASVAFNRSGWTVGAGVEWMFARNWSAFAEYDYADFGTVTGTLPGAAAITGGPNVVSQKTQLHTAMVGVNYRFEMLSRGGR